MSGLRITTAGESHGPSEICVVAGIPAGMPLAREDVDRDLARRQRGYGRGGRMNLESDRCRFVSGVRHGRTLGSPVCMIIENKDHVRWSETMAVEAVPAGEEAYQPVTIPRPGHADLAGLAKYGHRDVRDVLERASARETVGRVAGGAVCKRLLAELGVSVRARVVSLGGVTVSGSPDYARPDSVDWEAVERSPVGCEDSDASEAMCAAIDHARERGDSLGGVFEVWCWGICPGLGSYATFEERLDGRLAGALTSIPAVKGVEIATAFANAQLPGSAVHDALTVCTEKGRRWVARSTNRAGGLEGGVTNGMPIVLRAAMKPIPTLTAALPSVDISTLESTRAHVERSDVTAVPAARVVGEAMVAYVVAQAYMEKFGGDSLAELQAAVSAYEAILEERGLWRRLSL